MKHRGERYWAWADPTLHHRSHEQVLDNGAKIDVQARLSRTGATQLFVGVYAPSGMALLEEVYDCRPQESMARALEWGQARARAVADGAIATK